MKKKNLFITIILLTIGFAAVSTSLIINGNISFNTNEDDFDVYFSSAILDQVDVSSKVINPDEISITYDTKNLVFKGDTSELIYEVTNASKNYDAEVKVTCTDVSDEVTLTHTPETQVIEATKVGSGSIKVELNKTVVDEKELAFTCMLKVIATERTSLGENELTDYSLSGTLVNESQEVLSNTSIVVYSETPHYIVTDDYGYFYVSNLEKGNHEAYILDDDIENIKTMTKDEIIASAVSEAKFSTDSTTIKFTDNSEIQDSYITRIKNKKYDILLDSDGGILEETNINVAKNELFGELPEPTKENYAFKGWYYEDKKITNNTIVFSEEIDKLTAKWDLVTEYLIQNGQMKVDWEVYYQNHTTGSITYNANNIYFHTGMSFKYSNFHTSKKVDLTNVKSISYKININSDNVASGHLYISTSPNTTMTNYNSTAGDLGIKDGLVKDVLLIPGTSLKTLDVSSLTGEYYIGVFGSNRYITIYDIILNR